MKRQEKLKVYRDVLAKMSPLMMAELDNDIIVKKPSNLLCNFPSCHTSISDGRTSIEDRKHHVRPLKAVHLVTVFICDRFILLLLKLCLNGSNRAKMVKRILRPFLISVKREELKPTCHSIPFNQMTIPLAQLVPQARSDPAHMAPKHSSSSCHGIGFGHD